MNSLLTEILENVKRKHEGCFFIKRGKPIKSIRAVRENALERDVIINCGFHDLRHTFATHALVYRADLVLIRDILGHSDMRMKSKYTHSSEELKRRAVESLTEMLNQDKKEDQIFTNYSHNKPDGKSGSHKSLKIKDAGVAE